jgi:signal transduction histidine kinase
MKFRLPGGIRTSLTIVLLLIVGGALGGAYLMVVPSLERRLVEDRLDELQRDGIEVAAAYSTRDFSQPLTLDGFVASASFLYNARIVVYQVFGPSPLSLRPLADSTSSGKPVTDDPVALDTARTTQIARGRVERGGRPFGQVALPLLPSGNVLMLSAPIEDQLATVRVVKRRLLYATGVALLIAAILGSTAAAVHARRIRRLERAANRIAQGRFDQPVVDTGEDELGELAAAFERMRVQLAQLDTARKEFVANASHELRTPLFSLGGFLELMSDEDLDDETRAGFLATTREQVERLTRLSTDLLDLSRIDAGRLHVESEEVVLADVARALVDELQPIAEASGHMLALDAEPDAWALADEERVIQIGRALVANAIVHTPAGTQVVVRTEGQDGAAVLSVTDDGPGIPEEHADRIFDRFYRVEGAQASGSGLGLAIARELAERMGGTVELSHERGQTTFTLALPAVAATPNAVPVPS